LECRIQLDDSRMTRIYGSQFGKNRALRDGVADLVLFLKESLRYDFYGIDLLVDERSGHKYLVEYTISEEFQQLITHR
jgi:hypothetical protein